MVKITRFSLQTLGLVVLWFFLCSIFGLGSPLRVYYVSDYLQAEQSMDPNSSQSSYEGNKSIVLLIGDGMGINQIEFGNFVEFGDNATSPLLTFPYQTTVETTNIDGLTTDSAAAATAMATGVKTRNKRIATSWDGRQDLPTILEFAQSQGYLTGLVAKSHLTHATPAAFAAHEANRNDYIAIAQDFSQTQVSLMFGGGFGDNFMGTTLNDYIENSYQLITKNPLQNLLQNPLSLPILGLFANESLPRAMDYTDTMKMNIPSLPEMSTIALNLLSNTSSPFFLMIEASEIDWACHDHDSVYLAHEMIEFAETVRVVQDWALNRTDALVLITADHETGGFTFDVPDSEDFSSETNFPLPQENDTLIQRQNKRTQRAEHIEVQWAASGHTNTPVPLTSMGSNAIAIREATHLIDVFGIMRYVIDGKSIPLVNAANQGFIAMRLWIRFGSTGLVAISLMILLIWQKNRE